MLVDTRLRIFHLLLNVFVFLMTALALHWSESSRDVSETCPLLWESMLAVLVFRSMRVSMRAIVHRAVTFRDCIRIARPLDVILFSIFFVVECVTTSAALNNPDCTHAIGSVFDGHPLLAYSNLLLCVWDGCYILSFALHSVIVHSRN